MIIRKIIRTESGKDEFKVYYEDDFQKTTYHYIQSVNLPINNEYKIENFLALFDMTVNFNSEDWMEYITYTKNHSMVLDLVKGSSFINFNVRLIERSSSKNIKKEKFFKRMNRKEFFRFIEVLHNYHRILENDKN